MYSLKLISNKKDFEVYENFVEEKIQHQFVTIAHNPSIIEILTETFGYKPESYLIIDDDVIIGVLPGVRIGSKFVSIPHFSYGGPIIVGTNNEKDFLSSFFKNQNFEIRSFDNISEYANKDKVTCYIKLHTSVDEQWKSLKSKLRSQIKKGQSYEFNSIEGGIDLLSDFYSVYTKNMLRLGSPPLPIYFFRNILIKYKYGKASIIVVKYNNLPVAAGMTLSFKEFQEVCWASSDHEYNKYNVNMVLYWEFIKHSIIEKNKIFSFGRSSINSSTYKFKLQWEPTILPIFFNYSRQTLINIKKLTILSKIWKIQNLNLSIFLGKILSKYLY